MKRLVVAIALSFFAAAVSAGTIQIRAGTGAIQVQRGTGTIIIKANDVPASGACTAAGTAISFVNSASAASGTSANRTINIPAGSLDGHVGVAVGEYESDTNPAASITPPTDWALLLSTANIGTSPDDWIVIYVHRYGASEPANYTWTFASAFNGFGIATFKDVNLTCGPLDSVASSNTFTATANYVGKSITTGNPNAELILGQANFDGNANNCPAGWTGEGFDISQAALCYTVQASAGASGDINGSVSAGTSGAIGMTSLRD